jgi:hypothetical protein
MDLLDALIVLRHQLVFPTMAQSVLQGGGAGETRIIDQGDNAYRLHIPFSER